VLEVVDSPAAGRFDALLDGVRVGEATYVLEDDKMIVCHTGIRRSHGGKGYGTELVLRVLDAARTRGLTVVPECPFVGAVVARHPEYADLVEEP
jgi:predicted GNAT family acetyltransferase